MTETPYFVVGMHGLGDNIYQRPLVRAMADEREVYLMTPWPELYADMPIKFVAPQRKFRTQIKNMDRQNEGVFVPKPKPPRETKSFFYGLRESGDNAIREFERTHALPPGPLRFDLPDMGPSPVRSRRPVAVVRPATLRMEWVNRSRNPDPAYIGIATEILRAEGWYTVSVADVDPPEEVFVGQVPEAEYRANRGELGVRALIALIQHADLVIGPVGWIVPAAIAAGTPLIVIGGGQGGYNAPDRLTDPRMDLSRTRFLLPDPYCPCTQRDHNCPRRIPDFEAQFRSAIRSVALKVAA